MSGIPPHERPRPTSRGVYDLNHPPYRREGWREEAACASEDGALNPVMFDEAHPSPARRVCAVCPVTDECLAYALRRGERFGIWGGLTSQERKELASELAEEAS